MIKYRKLTEEIRQSFNDHYLNKGTGKYDTLTTQITQVFPLYYGLVPEEETSPAFEVLIKEIGETHNGHLSTGIFSTKMLFDVLRRFNRNDLSYTIVTQEDYPGYIYMLKEGATTLWETWNKPDQNSWNHPMFGSVSEWFYRSLLGINPSDDANGFDQLYIRPFITGGLEYAQGVYQSVRGKVISKWKRENDNLWMEVSVPPNVRGSIHIPAVSPESVQVDGRPVADNRYFKFIDFYEGYAIYEVGNGSFVITSEIE